MKKFKKTSLREKILISIIILLLVALWSVFSVKQSLKWDVVFKYEIIPHLDLTNTLSINTSDGLFRGSATGFVLFDNIFEQPKNVRQYYIIESSQNIDENYNQIFYLDTIMAFDYIPPTSIGKEELTEINEVNNNIVLQNKAGDLFVINKTSKDIEVRDSDYHTAKLVTNNLEYRDLVLEFFK